MPIGMPKSEWERIHKWTEYGKEDAETVQRREYVRQLDERSRKMTREWPNSLENVNRRNEEIRLARITAAEQANTKFYKKYVKLQKAEQERLMHSARDVIFKNKDAPKFLLSAVIETAIQKERAEQLKFKKKLTEEAIAKKRADDDEVLTKAREWHEMVNRQKEYRSKINKEHQNDIIDQIEERHDRRRNEYETELNQQKLDNMLAAKEMEAIKEFEQKLKEEEKSRIFSDMSLARHEAAAARAEREARDQLADKLQEVLTRARCRIDAKRILTEKELKEAQIRRVQCLSNKLAESTEGAEAKEMAIIAKAQQEKDAIEEAKLEAKRQKMESFKQERLESRKKYLQDEERRLHEMDTLRKWEMINRYKNKEIYDEFKERKRVERLHNISEYREAILKQRKEREDRESREREQTRYFYGELALRKLRDADNKLLTHAQQLLDECHEKERPDFALKRAIDKYCTMYRLYPENPLPAPLQKHFPTYTTRDLTKPDTDYVEPPPPPTKEQMIAAMKEKKLGQKLPQNTNVKESPKIQLKEEYKRQGRADGLQQIPEIKDSPKIQLKEEYKWQGRADGLQQKPEIKENTVLPAIASCCKC